MRPQINVTLSEMTVSTMSTVWIRHALEGLYLCIYMFYHNTIHFVLQTIEPILILSTIHYGSDNREQE
jgi:hypothetical protein